LQEECGGGAFEFVDNLDQERSQTQKEEKVVALTEVPGKNQKKKKKKQQPTRKGNCAGWGHRP